MEKEIAANKSISFNDLSTPIKPTWCPGCGNNSIFVAVKTAITEMNLNPSDVVFVEGIGCHGHIVNFLETNHFEGLHGRPLPVAQGIKLANHNLHVFVVSGDGDCLGEGGNHFLHALRRNVDITLLIHDNQIYGLTTGQYSPTSEVSAKTKTSPFGLIDKPLNPISIAITGGGTYVARSFAGNVKHLTQTIINAHNHKGFSVVDILQPCVTFNKINTFTYFYERVYDISKSENYKPDNKSWAFTASLEWGDKIPIGVFYKEERKTYKEQLPQLQDKPLVDQKLTHIDLSNAIKQFQ